MTIEFNKTFGTGANKGNAGRGNNSDLPKAQFWVNVGYDSGVPDDQGENRFVSIPGGIALDNLELLSTNSRNAEFASFQAARNNLFEQIMAVAQSLEAGESKILNLQVQLRRVNEETAPVDPGKNQFVKPLVL